MTKFCRILFMSGCLILQVVTALPKQNDKLLEEVMDKTFKKWGPDVLYDSNAFLKSVLKYMKDLQIKSEGIKANITRLCNALKEVEKIESEPDSISGEEVFETIDLLDEIFDDFMNMPNHDDPKSDAYLVMTLFEKASIDQNIENSDKARDNTIHEMEAFFETYEKQMDKEERHAAAELLKWYEEHKNVGDKPINLDLLARLKA